MILGDPLELSDDLVEERPVTLRMCASGRRVP